MTPSEPQAAGPIPRPLAAVAVGAGGSALLLLAGRLLGGDAFGWDRAVLRHVRGLGSPALDRVMIDLTALGGGTVLTLVVLAAAAVLLARRLWLTALVTVAATWSGGQVVRLTKLTVARARPDLVDRLVVADGASFPSGHAANSAVVYLTLAALGAQVARNRAVSRLLPALAIVLVVLIGTSRVYLGVHWPSDVLAGWCFGACWALGWWRVRSVLAR